MRVKREINSLTGLRFLAAFSVAAAHGAIMTLKFDQPQFGPTFWLTQGAVFGMTLFFVLSGFVIHYNYRMLVTEGGLAGIGAFIWARFARLYPLFLLVLLIDVFLGRELYNFMLGGTLGGTASFEATRLALPYYLSLTQSWFYMVTGDRSLTYAFGINAPLTWSISTEWFFYLAYIFLAPLIIRIRQPRSLVIACVTWCVVWWTVQLTVRNLIPQIDAWALSSYGPVAGMAQGRNSFGVWLTYFSPYSRIGEFILGAIVAQLYLQLQDRPVTERETRVGNALLAISVISLCGLIYERNFSSFLAAYFVPDFGPAPFIALIMFCVARYGGWVTRLLSSRLYVTLGDASYPIYLIHFLIFYLPFGYNQLPMTPTPIDLLFLTVRYVFLLALVLLISLGLHAYFEVPARQWLRGLWSTFQNSGFRTRYGIAPFTLLASPIAAALVVFLLNASDVSSPHSVQAGIRVVSASYGENCGAGTGNATKRLQQACDGRTSCEYRIDAGTIGDPVALCHKAFSAEYECAPDATRLRKEVPPEAGLGSLLVLECGRRE